MTTRNQCSQVQCLSSQFKGHPGLFVVGSETLEKWQSLGEGGKPNFELQKGFEAASSFKTTYL